jgi:hypothetical protein
MITLKTDAEIRAFQKKYGLHVDGIIGPKTEAAIALASKPTTSQWPSQAINSMNDFYGNPDLNRDGAVDAIWYQNNIVKITPPFAMFYPVEGDNGKIIKRGQRWQALRVHRKCADSLLECLTEIPQVFTAAEIEKYELDLCGGGHVFRLMRNGTRLSIHSWGAAIDLSHLINRYKRNYDASKGMMPQRAADIFIKRGWHWLKKNDAMHFQAARV